MLAARRTAQYVLHMDVLAAEMIGLWESLLCPANLEFRFASVLIIFTMILNVTTVFASPILFTRITTSYTMTIFAGDAL
jgi:hypothetical protein